ncbi:hypothetical protein C4577_05810 [Candidatus Parcubacteria bacterium]|nr:MAG: hypothetical protein C4577_05810 [Candidatus Parcubacteria bacterium]
MVAITEQGLNLLKIFKEPHDLGATASTLNGKGNDMLIVPCDLPDTKEDKITGLITPLTHCRNKDTNSVTGCNNADGVAGEGNGYLQCPRQRMDIIGDTRIKLMQR